MEIHPGPGVSQALAQTVGWVVARVNNQVISNIDVEDRARLIGIDPDFRPEDTPRLFNAAIEELVTETLQLQEAERLGLEIGDEIIQQRMEQIAANNQMSLGAFHRQLEVRGVDLGTVHRRLKAAEAWLEITRVVASRGRRISETEIREEIARLADTSQQNEYRLSEIFLPLDGDRPEPVILETIRKLREQIIAGERSFAAIARGFSKSPSARQNGDLGWVVPADLEANLARAVPDLREGQVSEPIRGRAGWHLLRLNETRARKQFNDTPFEQEWELLLRQALFPLPEGASDPEVARVMATARDISGILRGCDDIAWLHEQQGIETSGDLDPVPERNLPNDLAPLLQGLEIGRASPPYRIRDAVAVLMICSRREMPVDAELRRTALDRLRDRLLARTGREHFLKLRNDALIEITPRPEPVPAPDSDGPRIVREDNPS